MKLRLKKITAVAAVAFATSAVPVAASAWCYVDWRAPLRPSPEGFAGSYLQPHTKAVIASLKTMDKTVKTYVDKNSAEIAAAIDLLTTQKAVSSKQYATALKNNSQLEAQAIQEVNRSSRMKKALRDYGAKSMGYKACQVLAERQETQATAKKTDESIPVMVNREVTAKPGAYRSRREAMATRIALHDKYYCTADQAVAGLCTAEGSEAGKSLQAATLFAPSGNNTQEYRNKSSFINNMVGLPDDPVPKELASTSYAQSYSDLKRRKDAIKSTAITSLKAIQAQTSAPQGSEPSDNGNSKSNLANDGSTEEQQLKTDAPEVDTKAPQPLVVQIKKDVDRYLGGGKEHEEWSKTLAGAEEKGILTELVKQKALQLYLQTEKYKQYSRMEAMLASNVAAETINSGMEGKVEAQRQHAVRTHIRDTIKQNANK